jgi:anti-anti-sigma factor
MEFEITPIDAETSRVRLEGRMDSQGVDKIELRFSGGVVAAGRNAVIDLSQVTFLASMGIRLFITSARSLQHKGARMVLFGASEAVQSVLDTVALDQIIPITVNEQQAIARLKA